MMRGRLFLLALATAACTGKVAPPSSTISAVDPCLIAPRSGAVADTTIVGAEGIIDPEFAYRPRIVLAEAERVVFAQVYETLVRVTCDGRLVPGLADRWTGDTTGRVWTLSIRPDATFSDGRTVTSSDVVSAWTLRRNIASAFKLRPPGGLPVEGVTIDSDRALTVRLRDAHRDGPRPLADSYFAVHGIIASGNSAVRGSGPYVVHSLLDLRDRANPARETAVLIPRPGALTPVVVVRRPGADDGRDLIDAGVDVMVTSDRRVIDYVATRRDLQARPLPPDRAYALLSTLRAANATAFTALNGDSVLAALRALLERNVIRSGATSPESAWWGARADMRMCTVAGLTSPPAGTSSAAGTRARRLVYPADDPIAAGLAERFVALASFDPAASSESAAFHELFPELRGTVGTPLVAAGLRSDEFALSLARGSDLAYLVMLPRRTLDPCSEWSALIARSPWVKVGVPTLIAEAGPTLITSARAPALLIDWDNTVRIVTRTPPARSPR